MPLGRLENVTYSERQKRKAHEYFSKISLQLQAYIVSMPPALLCSSAPSPITLKRPSKLHHTELSVPHIHQLWSLWPVEQTKLKAAAESPEQELTPALRAEAWECPRGWCPSLLWAGLSLPGSKLWEERWVSATVRQDASWETGALLTAWQPVQMPSCQAQTGPQQLPQIQGWMLDEQSEAPIMKQPVPLTCQHRQEAREWIHRVEEEELHAAG